MNLFIKKKLLSILVAAMFVGSTVFVSTAAAKKIMQATLPLPGQAKSLVMAGQAAGKNVMPSEQSPVSEAYKPDEPSGLAEDKGKLSIQDNGRSQAAVVSLPKNQDAAETGDGGQHDAVQNVRNQNAVTQNQNTPNTQNSNPVSAAANTFTLVTLAAHNKTNDCFIAYKGKVYNLSNSAAWANCQHHGSRGGVDVTSTFPHAVSYFDSLPVVGTLVSAGSQNNQSATPVSAAQSSGSGASAGTGPAFQNKASVEHENEDDEDDDRTERGQKQANTASFIQEQNKDNERDDD